MDDADEDLTRLAMRQAFEAHDQYTETVPANDADRVPQLRRTGRSVAHELGRKIQTLTTTLDDDSTQVHLVITTCTPLRDQAMQARRQRKLRDALRNL